MGNGVPLDQLSCPAPLADHPQILLGHGSGGRLSRELLERVILPACGHSGGPLEDQALLDIASAIPGCGTPSAPQLAFTTDSFVVRPLFFPGGDIGKLAVHGTINDLAVGGARPLFLSTALILEEGLAIADLQRVMVSMRQACDTAGIALVTGDTKVVDRGCGDQLYISTSGIGLCAVGAHLSIGSAQPDDLILVSGTIGDHGIAIMSVREGIEFETQVESDTAPLHDLTRTMLHACPTIRCMRDPTRGGLSATLNELAEASDVGVQLDEAAIPVTSEVHSACELLGLDVLHVANEGKLVAVVPESNAEQLLAVMREHPLGRRAAIIGRVVADHRRTVVMRTTIGGQSVVPMLSGEQLPRIC